MEKSLKERVREYIEERVKPIIQRDGGDIELVDVSGDGIVYVRLKGQCISCPSSTYTLKVGIEEMIKIEIDGVKEVRAVK